VWITTLKEFGIILNHLKPSLYCKSERETRHAFLLHPDWWSTLVHAFIASRVDYCNAICSMSLTASSDDWTGLMHAAGVADHPTLRAHHSQRHCVTFFTGCRYHSAWLSELRWRCSTVLAADVWSRPTSVMCAFLYTHRCCSFALMTSEPMWPRRPTRAVHSVWLALLPRVIQTHTQSRQLWISQLS